MTRPPLTPRPTNSEPSMKEEEGELYCTSSTVVAMISAVELPCRCIMMCSGRFRADFKTVNKTMCVGHCISHTHERQHDLF